MSIQIFFVDKTNPRVLVVTRVLLGICQLRPDDNQLDNVFTMEKGLRRKVDSFTNEDKSYFIKTNINEIYPETILIYRDKNGPPDQRGSRIMELSKRYGIFHRNVTSAIFSFKAINQ